MKNEIVLYQSNELPERIEVRIEEETVWLNRQQLAVLFGRDIKTIGKHALIKVCFLTDKYLMLTNSMNKQR